MVDFLSRRRRTPVEITGQIVSGARGANRGVALVTHDIESEVHRILVADAGSASPRSTNVESISGRCFGALDPVLHVLRVLIIDDAQSTRRYLWAVLSHCADFDVVGEAVDGDAGIRQAEVLQPDLVLLDLFMPTLGGGRALQEILQVAPRAIVVVMSGIDRASGCLMLDAGATAVLPKGIPPIDLLDRLGTILGRSITPDRAARPDQADRTGRPAPPALPPLRSGSISIDVGELKFSDGTIHATGPFYSQAEIDELVTMIERRSARTLWGPHGESHFIRPVHFTVQDGNDFPKMVRTEFKAA
jgi:DNA-binding NarL/FixJ family response regulator